MKAEEKGTHKEKVEAMQKKFDVRPCYNPISTSMAML